MIALPASTPSFTTAAQLFDLSTAFKVFMIRLPRESSADERITYPNEQA
jgi:hypothetical protein